MIDINAAIHSLCPGSEWVLINNNYSQIRWVVEPENIPTIEEIQDEITRLQAEYDAKEYARKRVKEYPSIGDQLDALWKGGDAAAEMLAKVQAVKTKYPKPE
jgi:hypothetical protein